MTNLHALVAENQQIKHKIADAEGEISDEALDALVENSEALSKKVDDVKWAIDRLAHEAEFWADKASELLEISSRYQSAATRLKARVERIMIESGKKELSGDITRFVLVKKASSVEILDENSIPPKYIVEKFTTSCDKKAIKTALQAGEKIPGAQLKEGVYLRDYPVKAELKGKKS